MIKKAGLVLICTVLAVYVFALGKDARQQKKEERKEKINQLIKQEEEGALIYQKQNIFGVKLTTDGYGAFYRFFLSMRSCETDHHCSPRVKYHYLNSRIFDQRSSH